MALNPSPQEAQEENLLNANVVAAETKGLCGSDEEEESAARRVLFTTELLEKILLQLPVKSMFGVQRTCGKFRDTTRGSKHLQYAMFLVPDTEYDPEQVNPIMRQLAYRGQRGKKTVYICFTGESSASRIPTFEFSLVSEADYEQYHSEKSVVSHGVGEVTESWRRMYVVHSTNCFFVKLRYPPMPIAVQGRPACTQLGELFDTMSSRVLHS
ncbi:Hypothetical predicted protein [Lecanosticta acicola]|uniref:F-box domain-containing protein n=1 Tax=Lecanosticta acicola TaxID=111012 RepID=A0AAI9E8Z1_9PEZI|nr:Hypothetical predicted protein [Lecanosticta acicola]